MAQVIDPPPNRDFISELPKLIKVKVLEYLSIHEAVRSSILSKSWRYTWTNMTKLDIDSSDFPSSNSIIDFIDMFLLLHNGSISQFIHRNSPKCQFPIRRIHFVPRECFDRWISILSRRNIQSLLLSFSLFRRYKMPSYFYSCHALEIINLQCCVMDVPFTFNGFRLLKSLSLLCVKIDRASFKRLITNSPSLEMLEITELVDHDCLQIRAPNLKDLLIRGAFAQLYLDVPSLVHARFEFYDGNINNLSYALSRVPNIQKLDITEYRPEDFNIENSLEKLSIKFNNLNEITIFINLSDRHDISCALFLFENAPNFQTLRLMMKSRTSEEADVISLLESKLNNGSVFMKLTTMYVDGPSTSDKLVMAFLKFVLLTAPLLKKVSLSKSHWKYEANCLELMKLHGKSNEIEILLLQEY